MSGADGVFTVLRLPGGEEIDGSFALVAEVCGLPLVAFVDEEAGLVVPWSSVLAAATKAAEVPDVEEEPATPDRHKVSIEGSEGEWRIACACGWERSGPRKVDLLDAAEDHMAAQRKR